MRCVLLCGVTCVVARCVGDARVHVHRLGCSAARLAWVSVLCAASRACCALIGALTRVVGVFAPLSLSCFGSRPVDAPKAAVLSVRRAAWDFPPVLATPAGGAGGSFVGALAGRAWVTCTGSGLFVRFVFYGHHLPRFSDPPARAWPARPHFPLTPLLFRSPSPTVVGIVCLWLLSCARARAHASGPWAAAACGSSEGLRMRRSSLLFYLSFPPLLFLLSSPPFPSFFPSLLLSSSNSSSSFFFFLLLQSIFPFY